MADKEYVVQYRDLQKIPLRSVKIDVRQFFDLSGLKSIYVFEVEFFRIDEG